MKLINGDCLIEMKNIKDNSIDMILCDLPYGTTSCKWDSVIPFDKLWEQYERIIKDNGAIVLFGQEPFSSHLRLSNLKLYKYDWIWKKTNPSNIALANKQPMRYHELISVFYKRQPKYNKQMIQRAKNGTKAIKTQKKSGRHFVNRGSEQTGLKSIKVDPFKYDNKLKNPSTVLEFNSLRPMSKEFVKHPTQKPTDLVGHLVKTYTDENDLVLDNCMGSGTTGVACVRLKRDFIGIEKETEYFKLAKQRIENEIK